jgi:hypothetical protein
MRSQGSGDSKWEKMITGGLDESRKIDLLQLLKHHAFYPSKKGESISFTN